MKLTYEYIKDEIEKEDGYHLLSNDYINNKTHLIVRCKFGHIYNVTYNNFQHGYRCPICARESNAKKISLDYEYVKGKIEECGYVLLSKEYHNCMELIDIQCDKGHIYKSSYNHFQQGHRCHICSHIIRSKKVAKFNHDNRITKEQIINFINNCGYKFLSFIEYNGSLSRIKILCNRKHVYKTSYTNFQIGHRCPICCCKNSSNKEKEVQDWIGALSNIKKNHRFYYDVRRFYETDIFIPSRNIAIEFDGIYYHSEKSGTDKNYHLDKTEFFEKKGIQIIHVFENEWILKQDIVKSIILNKLGLSSNKIYARNCHIKLIDVKEAKEFLEQNHLQGYVGSSIRIGLFYKDELVSVMTFSKPRFSKKYDWELSRFCHKLNYNIIGGFSKLLKYFRNNYQGSIVSYADRRYSNGNVYLKNGFEFSHVTKPNYFYFKNGYILESRNKYQKHKLSGLLENFDSNLTEWDNMRNNGYNRIFDCGNLVFIKED